MSPASRQPVPNVFGARAGYPPWRSPGNAPWSTLSPAQTRRPAGAAGPARTPPSEEERRAHARADVAGGQARGGRQRRPRARPGPPAGARRGAHPHPGEPDQPRLGAVAPLRAPGGDRPRHHGLLHHRRGRAHRPGGHARLAGRPGGGHRPPRRVLPPAVVGRGALARLPPGRWGLLRRRHLPRAVHQQRGVDAGRRDHGAGSGGGHRAGDRRQSGDAVRPALQPGPADRRRRPGDPLPAGPRVGRTGGDRRQRRGPRSPP